MSALFLILKPNGSINANEKSIDGAIDGHNHINNYCLHRNDSGMSVSMTEMTLAGMTIHLILFRRNGQTAS